jgi:hypothetical protein
VDRHDVDDWTLFFSAVDSRRETVIQILQKSDGFQIEASRETKSEISWYKHAV